MDGLQIFGNKRQSTLLSEKLKKKLFSSAELRQNGVRMADIVYFSMVYFVLIKNDRIEVTLYMSNDDTSSYFLQSRFLKTVLELELSVKNLFLMALFEGLLCKI